ncbi:hypothetical protein YC2023_094165 [Brassica napus]
MAKATPRAATGATSKQERDSPTQGLHALPPKTTGGDKDRENHQSCKQPRSETKRPPRRTTRRQTEKLNEI